MPAKTQFSEITLKIYLSKRKNASENLNHINNIVSADNTSQTRYARLTDIICHLPARSSLCSSPVSFQSASRLYYCSAL